MKFADVGCGYGGLLLTLSEMFPNDFSVGFEIRVKVSDYVQGILYLYIYIFFLIIFEIAI